ncbi:hypothetical protein GZ176_03370 [Dermatophilus congolensis]|nr:hypothetical protein [Dermatophilus congolensis]MBO3131339.1 hypothetical protein [Dermatophilus congolensis]MBO3134505.1 hypothetical protein [Dermatophilus congolensis]MBO3138985.1 hypothetical protein [Dermatophilus congolensis]MBO3141219.1 hypothetical protein [Dermatophilus congolensis]MBO3144740.1 hypothetical protein [Dermatophilus congolensis]
MPDTRHTRQHTTKPHQQRDWITLDRVPLAALAALLTLSLAGAEIYLNSGLVIPDTPFRPVWASYDRATAITLVTAALIGLLGAATIPLKHPIPLTWRTTTHTPTTRSTALWLTIAASGVTLGLIAKGQYLLWAPAYLTFEAPPPIISLASVIAPVALIAAGIVSTRHPWTGALLAIAMATILFSGATRLFAGSAVLFLIGRLLGGIRVHVWAWFLGGTSAAIALPIPLLLRNQLTHGLIPYTEATISHLSEPGYLSTVISTIAENVGFTVPLLVHVAAERGITIDDILIELNPAPASIAGWDRIVASMRVHYYIPYSMLGEFASFGALALTVAVFVWGTLLRLCIQLVADPDCGLSLLFLAAQLGLSLISVLYITQYNTRNVNRVVTMMIALALAFYLAKAFLAHFRSSELQHPDAPALTT